MPAPAAPTSLTITQPDANKPRLVLDWSHSGVDLDRFEVLFKRPEDTVWSSHMLAPKTDFGVGPYSVTVSSAEGYEWAVRALNAAGEPSV